MQKMNHNDVGLLLMIGYIILYSIDIGGTLKEWQDVDLGTKVLFWVRAFSVATFTVLAIYYTHRA